ncbi:hypothetical protein OQZ33_21970 [Pedobacter sp. MC2016-05]|uniref:hypothetical protein n=1 Tax=Pedobacter sp. MC2016-05 TaxID=2994474 RepID=UPI0022464B85|nr:hypothetical protein [Pedobacter sp. MC2016-05]MCX2477017.1 hypothetical protein [Pedobacter sp. MC2016-05]
MKIISNCFLIFSIALITASCRWDGRTHATTDSLSVRQEQPDEKRKIQDHLGLYVSKDYEKSAEGYDWVSVRITVISQDSLAIQVRSRDDMKKPTCTLDAKADKTGEGSYRIKLQYGTAILSLGNNSINIRPESTKDEAGLAFPCSGGATIAGTYKKV